MVFPGVMVLGGEITCDRIFLGCCTAGKGVTGWSEADGGDGGG